MEIILKEDIIGLGYKNDIVTVKNGYGRNYLIPQGKAVVATAAAKKILAENLRQQAHKLAALKAEAEKKAAALEGVRVEIASLANRSGQLYGSVGAAHVADALEKKGIDIDRKIITMRDVRQMGEYEAIVHFHKEVEVKVPVTVVAENAAELAAEAAAEKALRAAKPVAEETNEEEVTEDNLEATEEAKAETEAPVAETEAEEAPAEA
ncbi:MAG: 50S ribosomal protein L9 [Bacteroidaceae bacterium]|nr:50S ribosomal protein L9 [Bacteroidaceae bacterium]